MTLKGKAQVRYAAKALAAYLRQIGGLLCSVGCRSFACAHCSLKRHCGEGNRCGEVINFAETPERFAELVTLRRRKAALRQMGETTSHSSSSSYSPISLQTLLCLLFNTAISFAFLISFIE